MRHPDEGEIHAWLDGALTPAAASELEAHVAACPACSAAVVEARGLMAGASRILLALDDVPSGVIPAAPPVFAAGATDDLAAHRSQQQRDRMAPMRRHVPWFARRPVQIAAGLLLMVGIGGVVARDYRGEADQVTVQFETDMAPPSRGPAAVVVPSAGASQSAEVVGTPAPLPTSPSARQAEERRKSEVQSAEGLTASKTNAANQSTAQAPVADAFSGVGALGRAASSDAFGAGAPRPTSPVTADRAAALPASRAPVPAAAPAPSPPPPSSAVFPPFAPPAVITQTFAVDSVQRSRSGVRSDSGIRLRSAVAQGTIAGKVVTEDAKPIDGATVMVAGSPIGTTTGSDGSFTLPPLAPGRYTVQARRIGYASVTLDGVELASGDTAFTRLAMKPSQLKLSEVVVTGASASNVGGACFALDVDPGNDRAGIPLLPSRVRIRLAEGSVPSSVAKESAARGAAGGRGGAVRSSAELALKRVEPSSALQWEAVTADSIRAEWDTGTDFVTLHLRVRGDNVSGTATSTRDVPARTATVIGRRVVCGGE